VIDRLLEQKIREYGPTDAIEQENVLTELVQLMVLSSLSRAGLFREAIFHGGTCLRLTQSLPRFSEDLDFLLKSPDQSFNWGPYAEAVRRDCLAEGVEVTADWYVEQLGAAISSVDWSVAADDVSRFVGPRDRQGLDHWGEPLFSSSLSRLERFFSHESA